jgi:hypothetical protein
MGSYLNIQHLQENERGSKSRELEARNRRSDFRFQIFSNLLASRSIRRSE